MKKRPLKAGDKVVFVHIPTKLSIYPKMEGRWNIPNIIDYIYTDSLGDCIILIRGYWFNAKRVVRKEEEEYEELDNEVCRKIKQMEKRFSNRKAA